MSRSGYSDDCDQWDLIRWRGAVNSAIRGKRGQAFLRELAAAMDAMPDKRLIADELQADGAFCTLGVIGAARGVDMSNLDPYDRGRVAGMFNVAEALAAEIMYENDDRNFGYKWIEVEICGPMRPHVYPYETHKRRVRVEVANHQEARWRYMRAWIAKHITDGVEGSKP